MIGTDLDVELKLVGLGDILYSSGEGLPRQVSISLSTKVIEICKIYNDIRENIFSNAISVDLDSGCRLGGSASCGVNLSTSFDALASKMSRSTPLETAKAFIEGYNTKSIMSFRAPYCIHQVLPLSLGREPLNNAQFLAYFTPIMPAFTNFNLSSKNTVVDEEAKKAMMHSSSTAKDPIQNATTILNSFGSCNILLNSRRSVETNSVCSAHSRCRTNSREAP